MDHNTKSQNTADALLQKLKQNMAQNDSDKESIAAEEAAAKKSHTTRYKFRVMKRAEYLEKKQIADALAAAADSADISDDELEALLRNYLKNIPKVDPVVEEVPAEQPRAEVTPTEAPAAAPVIDLDQPLSHEDAPFFEDAPLDESAEEVALEADALDGLLDDDLSALLELLPEEMETSAEEAAPAKDTASFGMIFDEEFSDAAAVDTPVAAEAEVIDEPAAASEAVTDDELAALLAAIESEDDDTLDAALTEEPIEDDLLTLGDEELDTIGESLDAADDDLAALLASLPEDGDDTDEVEVTDMTETEAEAVSVPVSDDELEAILSAMEEEAAVTAENETVDAPAEPVHTADAVTDDELAAILSAMESETDIADDDALLSEDEALLSETELTEGTDLPVDDSLLDELAALAADAMEGEGDAAQTDAPADTADAASDDDDMLKYDMNGDGEFDQTDLDLMIAFGMEDQLESAVGHERAKKYKKAIGDRSDNHFNEMHSGDRPDTVQDKHAEYVSAAQNREIFSEYKKKYSGMLFRFLGALFFFILLFFFENDRLLGITMPAIFDREQYPLVYTLFDLQLVILAGAMVWRGIRTGIRAIFRGRPVPESITGFLFLACIVYTVVIAALCPMHGLQLYNFPLGLAVLFQLCYEFMNLRREIMSFKIVSSKKLKYAVDAIAPKDGEAERKMFAEYISDDPALFRIKRTAFVESFFARTETYPRTQRILRAILPAVFLMVLAFFAAKFILSGSVYEALTLSYITMLLTLPSCAFIAFSYPMYLASGFAYEKDSAMIGEASLGEYADASVVSFDDKEVFPARGIRVRNVKVYGENRIDHVIYAAASVFHVVGGPLAEVFETATGELGYAENVKLTRLDRDGIESRVDGGTVLIGRAAFINRYGYAVSLNESEKSMEETGDASILYIAYDNNVAAKLYIQYSVEPDFEVVLKQLYRQGVCVGIKTSDPNIDDHLLSCKIKMSKYPVKIIKCAEPKETAIIVDRMSSGIVSKSSAKALLQTLAICDRVLSASRTNNVLSVVSILLGMAAMAFCIFSGMAVTLAPVWIALYQLFWIIPVIAISRYYI